MRIFLLCCIVVLCSFIAKSQNKPVVPLATDRPDKTESTYLVPNGAVQFELGAQYEYDNENGIKVKSFETSSLLVRYGLGDLIELRLNIAHTSQETESGGSVSRLAGLRPLSVGVKLFVTEQKGVIPRTVFIGHIGLPYGKDEFSPERIVPSFLFVFSNDITDRFGLAYSFGPSWEDDGHYESFYSVVGGYSIIDWLGTYLEFYGTLLDSGPDNHLIDGGFTFLIRPNLQADISTGFGLNSSAADFFVGIGISWRVPR
jgi:hypothetical protein